MTLKKTGILLLGASIAVLPACQAQKKAQVWLTNPDRSALFQHQTAAPKFSKTNNAEPTIHVDASQRYQSIDGFGFALTGGSAQLMMRMSPSARAALLRELFSPAGNGIGVSYLRVSIGASDMNDHVYSYDDLPEGETDPGLTKFSLAPDRANVIPVLKEILTINPKIKILGSPWSAPAWMKTNGK
ncbi:MAG TPA: glucosylceramidase, partial [Edaphobacter sp.]|nr:glucosylceramidase [Edaphobacter sp.]